jgi:hypothetical protein
MISVGLAVPAVLLAAALAGSFTYFVTPPPSVKTDPQLPEKTPELRMGIPANVDRPRAEEKTDEFLQAAQAILKQDQNAQASADKPSVTGHIPLPKKRPIPGP